MIELLTIKVKLFTEDRSNLKFIEYDHDCGHAYSFINHSIVDEVEETMLADVLTEWLYENDDCPDCTDMCDTCN